MEPPHNPPPLPGSRTLAEMLAAVTAEQPDAVAAVEWPDRRILRYRELLDRAEILTAVLAERGIGRGDVVGVWLPNWTDTVVWQFATVARGAAVLGLNTRYNVHELAHLLRTAQPRCLTVPYEFLGLDFSRRLRIAVRDAEVPAPQVAVARARAGSDLDAFDAGAGAWSVTDAAPAGPAPDDTGHGGDLSNLFTTSGTTSAPKLAGHDQASVVTHAHNVATAIGLRPGDAVGCVLPLTGVFGFTPAVAALAIGATCVLQPVFDADGLLDAMEREAITHLIGGDDLFVRLRSAWSARPVDLSSWRGGGIADFIGRVPEVLRWAEERFGARVTGVYGSSELFALTALWDPQLNLTQRAVAGGRPVASSIHVRVVDPDSNEPVGSGVDGELQFRGYNVTDGYLNAPEATARAFTADGWFRTGDLGKMLPGGGLAYLCRRGDAMRLRGFLVNPSEIERFLAEHETVDVAKVVGAPAGGGGNVAVGFVTLRDGSTSTEEDLLSWCRDRLAAFKVPARVIVMDELPTTTGTNGPKIRTTELRDRAAALMRES